MTLLVMESIVLSRMVVHNCCLKRPDLYILRVSTFVLAMRGASAVSSMEMEVPGC
jgi:hypothetical protein